MRYIQKLCVRHFPGSTEVSFSPSFPFPHPPVLLSPHFTRRQNTSFLSFLPGSLSFFFFSVSRIGTCRTHAYLINGVFNFTEESCSRCERFRNERDSARRKIQILEKEIQVLKKNSEDCEGINQTLHKNLENLKEEQGNLQLPLENLEVVKKEQQGKITKLTRKNKELENKVTKKTSEIEKILAREQKLKKKVEECVKKSLKDTKTKDVELEKMSVENKLLYEENKRLHEENKRLHEESNVVRSNWDKLREQVKRWKLRLREMPERKWFV